MSELISSIVLKLLVLTVAEIQHSSVCTTPKYTGNITKKLENQEFIFEKFSPSHIAVKHVIPILIIKRAKIKIKLKSDMTIKAFHKCIYKVLFLTRTSYQSGIKKRKTGTKRHQSFRLEFCVIFEMNAFLFIVSCCCHRFV